MHIVPQLIAQVQASGVFALSNLYTQDSSWRIHLFHGRRLSVA